MRNLYLRFFFSFWTAMVVVLAFTVMATLWIANERRDRETERQDKLARDASAVLASDGVPGLRDWLLQQLPVQRPDRVYVINDSGQDLLGRPVPDFLQARVGRRPFPTQRGTRDERLLSRLVAPNNESFALSLSVLRPPFGLFGPPETPIIAAVLTLLVSTIVCFLLARSLSAPIKLLRNATHSIAAGDLNVRVSGLLGTRRDELATLAVDFDVMAVRLRALLDSHQHLLRDVSHELRSPLARLQIALGLARRPSANLTQEFDRIEHEAQRLDDLIGEILSLCRLDDPARTLRIDEVAIDELLETLVENARIEAEPRDVSISLLVPAGMIVQGDRELLYRAVENVLRNAVRFSPDHGRVEVQAQARAAGISLVIRDSGPGVPADSLQRIFEPFYRVGEARDRDSGGHGIGLAITARVVRLHDGTVTAANQPSGGLEVTITLPLAPRALPAMA
jgi:two-component system sensor histidine kinase CpxA